MRSEINPGHAPRGPARASSTSSSTRKGNGYRDKDDYRGRHPQSHRATARQRGSGGHIARKGALRGSSSTCASPWVTPTCPADGRIADAFDLRFAVEAEDLSLLKQESRGKLKGKGTLHGTWADPIINAEVARQ